MLKREKEGRFTLSSGQNNVFEGNGCVICNEEKLRMINIIAQKYLILPHSKCCRLCVWFPHKMVSNRVGANNIIYSHTIALAFEKTALKNCCKSTGGVQILTMILFYIPALTFNLQEFLVCGSRDLCFVALHLNNDTIPYTLDMCSGIVFMCVHCTMHVRIIRSLQHEHFEWFLLKLGPEYFEGDYKHFFSYTFS